MTEVPPDCITGFGEVTSGQRRDTKESEGNARREDIIIIIIIIIIIVPWHCYRQGVVPAL